MLEKTAPAFSAKSYPEPVACGGALVRTFAKL
jgi:hypothetical protein